MPLIRKQNLNDVKNGCRFNFDSNSFNLDNKNLLRYVGISETNPEIEWPSSNGIPCSASSGSIVLYKTESYVCDNNNNWIKIGELIQ